MSADLFLITFEVVLPIFLMASIGFVSRRSLGLDPRQLSPLGIYVLMPALLFNSLTTTQIQGDEVVRIGIFTVALLVILVIGTSVFSKFLRAERQDISALTMSVAFMNSANYGLPVCLFAFGQEGFERAVVFAAFQSICTFSVAVFIAAKGKHDWRQALQPALRMPVLWAAAAALVLRGLGAELPVPMQRGVTVLAGGAIPVTVLLLGMQLAELRLERIGFKAFAAVAGRLGVSPVVALLLVILMNPTELTGKVLILEAAMPTAVNITLLAMQFDTRPELVSTIVLLTTALSLLTVTGWVAFLQGGFF
jgi:malate permease and related proteins